MADSLRNPFLRAARNSQSIPFRPSLGRMRADEVRFDGAPCAPRLEGLYVWYAATLVVLLIAGGANVPARWLWVAGHLAVVPLALALARAPLLLRYLAPCLLVPAAFTSLGALVPEFTPEPMEFSVRILDESLGGAAVRHLFASPPPWLVELCQFCYSTFYFLPFVLGFALLRKRRFAALAHAAELITGGFLLSYLGYLCFPTLPPSRFVPYPAPLSGGPVFRSIHPLLDRLEPIRQDCMPSGHTMVTLLVLYLAWRYDRRQLLWALPVGGFLILGTIVLRYHWWADLVAGAVFALFAGFLFRPEGVR